MSLDPGWSAERVLNALVESLDEVVLVFDEDQRCRGAGAHARALFGVEVATLLGLRRKELLRLLSASSDDAAAFEAAVEAATDGSQQTIEIARPERRQVVWRTVPFGSSDAPAGALDIVRDVTSERAAALQIKQMAKALADVTTVDPVTGLSNQRRFLQDLDREHRRAQRVWECYALARLDVNDMASLNAALGWAVGDEVLRRIGEELRTSRREYDLVGRWRADEFVLCLPGADAAAAKAVLDRTLGGMYARVKEAFARPITVGVGVAVWIPPSSDSPEDVVERAGAALEAARRRGPTEIVVDGRAGRWKEGAAEE
jgi:diguanylate cyclase (GGDEF)-like protein